MNKAKANTGNDDEEEATSKICNRSREGNIFAAKSVDEYAQSIGGHHHGDEDLLCKWIVFYDLHHFKLLLGVKQSWKPNIFFFLN